MPTQTKPKPKRTSKKKIHANKRNAQKSTGPRTRTGKDRSKYNAERHGLLTKLIKPVRLASETTDEFSSLAEDMYQEFQPYSLLEKILVERLVSIAWRFRRHQLVEAYAVDNNFDRPDPSDQNHRKDLKLLCRYETMLDRQFDKIVNQLEKLKKDRIAQEEENTKPKTVKLRNEPKCSENDANPLQFNKLQANRSSAKSQTPPPTAARNATPAKKPVVGNACPPAHVGIFPTNIIRGGQTRPKLI